MDWKKGGARYVDAINNKTFMNTFNVSTFNEIIFKIMENLLFILSKTIFHRYRYVKDNDIKLIDMRSCLNDVVTYHNLGTVSPQGSSVEIVKLDLIFNDDAFDNLIMEADVEKCYKKFVKSFKKFLQQYGQFLDQVMKPALDIHTPEKKTDKARFLIHRMHVKHLMSMFDSNHPLAQPNKLHSQKKLIYLDGFIMEGKSERLEYYKKNFEQEAMCFEEQSDWWRIDILFQNSEPKKLLDFQRFVMAPSVVEFLYNLGMFMQSDKTMLVSDRSLFSAAVFNGSLFLPSFQLFFLRKFFSFKSMELDLFRKIDYKDMPFPLYPKREFETRVYKNAEELQLSSQMYYSGMNDLLNHFGMVYPPVYKTCNLNRNEFRLLETEEQINF